jgi:ribosomal protein S18 acetylase RimI-like enzyme
MEITEAKSAREALDFYYMLIDKMTGNQYKPSWKRGVYPLLEDIEIAVSEHSQFLAREGGAITGAFILNRKQGKGYDKASWKYPADKEKVSVIHLLAVNPDIQHKGIGIKLLTKAEELARTQESEVLRLDTMTTNIPAQKLYEKYGFSSCGDVDLTYPSTGKIPFRMYELKL